MQSARIAAQAAKAPVAAVPVKVDPECEKEGFRFGSLFGRGDKCEAAQASAP
ncbi:hypothetical protein D3C86_2183010 [compost metagenome]